MKICSVGDHFCHAEIWTDWRTWRS